MQRIQRLLPFLIAVLMLVPVSVDLVSGKDHTVIRAPTRAYFQESESNNQWSEADVIPVQSGSSMELHGNLSSSSDFDYFYISLTGGAGPVDRISIIPNYVNASDPNDMFLAWFWGFLPDEIDGHNSGDEVSLAVDLWYPDPLWWTSITFHASYTGRYGLIVRPYSTLVGNLKYNLTVTVTPVTPADDHNDIGSAKPLNSGSSLVSGSLTTDQDLFDWYKISAPNPIHPTILDMTFTLGAYSPDYNYGSYDWGAELDMFLMYNSRDTPLTFTSKEYRVASSTRPNFIQNGCSASPLEIDVEKNCTEMYIGVMIRSYGVASNGQRTYSTTRGSASYNLGLDINANIPNKRPVIMDAKVEPTRGDSNDIFRFSVVYKDPQNETAKHVELWLDGEFFKELSPVSLLTYNYTVGVEYFIEVPGRQIGTDAFHNFNISASDGKEWAIKKESGSRKISGPIVDDNIAPQSDWGDAFIVALVEDTDVTWLVLDDLFSDPNSIEPSFTYLILDERGEWDDRNYEDENLTVEIVNNGTVGVPEFRLKIMPEPNVNGVFTVRINASDGEFFEKFAELDIVIEIAPVNDPPEMRSIGSSSLQEWDEQFMYDVEQEEMVEVRVRAQDMDGDELEFSWDIGDVLTSPMEGVNYGFNSSSGDLWFIPGDGDVPGFETVVTVTDGQGGEDQFRLIYSVDNINDPPTIIVPAERSTIEGEYLYIVPTFNDPDIDSGDVITFAYDLGELGQRTPSSAIEFTQSNGRLVLKAIAEEMIGEWEVNITVVDFAGLADWGICHVTIGNVNDPPEIFDISIEQQSGNLTVKFHTSEATDEDQGDVLTYMWDFGDGSEPVSGVGLKDIEHEFLSAGAFTVTMKVWDGFAYSEPKELIVTVTAPPPDPDQDKDGIDDDWELRFGFDPNDPLDAVLDADNDGMTNLEEFQYFISTGEYLNPRNPDSDSDGWKDGEEFDRSYDPLNKDEHPDDPNEDWNLLLWIAALASIVLGIGALAAFLFSLMRNRKGARAVPVAAAPIPTSMDQLTNVPYEQMPPADMEALPPAPIVAEDMLPDQTQQYYDQGQSFDQGPVYEQTQQYNDQDQTFYQAAPDMEQDMGLIGDGQVLPQDPGGSGPGDQGFGPIIEPPVPEVVPADDNVPKEAVVPEGASDVRKDDVETEKEEGPSGLPPIPDLPDI